MQSTDANMSIKPEFFALGAHHHSPMFASSTLFRHLFPDDSCILRCLIFTTFNVAEAEVASQFSQLALLDHLVYWIHWTWQRILIRISPLTQFSAGGQATLENLKLNFGPVIEAMEAARRDIFALLFVDSQSVQHEQIKAKVLFIKESLHRAWAFAFDF
jgi:hypothetical protein